MYMCFCPARSSTALVDTGLILLRTTWGSAPIWTRLLLIYTSVTESTVSKQVGSKLINCSIPKNQTKQKPTMNF